MAKKLEIKWLAEGYPIDIINESLQCPLIQVLDKLVEQTPALADKVIPSSDYAQLTNL